uniref:Post-GPI attachment to proteins 6 n=1 Tax=Sphenodon punctatus TaxID=8508 RepID=A0A8D0HNA4_SPHPU
MARSAIGLLLLVVLVPLPSIAASALGTRSSSPIDVMYVSEYFSQSAQKLSFYSWYGNAKLFHFRVPEDTILLRWLLQASRGKGPECTSMQITIHFRYGAPPVINPLGTHFPSNTTIHPSYNQTITVTAALQNSTFVNITNPAAGDWFIAAHLPEAAGKIEVKGFSSPCAYIFQPDMFVLRTIDVPVLEPDTPMQQTIVSPARPLHVKIFIPEYTTMLHFELRRCMVNVSMTCAVRVTLGSVTLPQSFQKMLNCTGRGRCSMTLDSPPWEKRLQITAESLSTTSASVSFEMIASFSACKPGSTSSFLSFYNSLNGSQSMLALGHNPKPASPGEMGNATQPEGASAQNASTQGSSCLHNQPVIREDLDVVSVRFRVINEPSVPVQSEFPTLLLFNLNTGVDSGGTLMLNLLLNKVK